MKGEISLFGIRMHACTMQETIDEVDARIRGGIFTQHVVINVAKLVRMKRDARLREAVEACDIVNIDGAGVVFGARLLGMTVPERVTGIDLFFRLLEYAECAGRPVFFLGARPDVIQQAVESVRARYPKLLIAGYHHGYFWNDPLSVVQRIQQSGAELLFVGISSPLKEQFIDEYRTTLGARFAMGVGGTFDIVAGRVRRAPRWMQSSGLEWLYRLAQEPRRMFVRYLTTNGEFAWMLLKEACRRTFRFVR